MTKIEGAIIIEGHVQGLSNVRSLGEKGIPVIVIDKNNCIARYSKYCKKFFTCPDFSSDEFISFLVSLAEKEGLRNWILIPSNDHIVHNLSRHKALISKYYKTIVPDIEVLNNIYDKKALIALAQNSGIPIPKTYVCNDDSIYSSLPYPILIKGREGLTFFKATGKKGFRANSEIELVKVLNDIGPKIQKDRIILQEIVEFKSSKDVWSYTGFSITGETKAYWIGRKLREHPIKYGTATAAFSDHNSEVEEYGKKLVKELNFTGVCEIEFVWDSAENKFKLIEMNPRTWLWVGLAKYCGIDYMLYIYNYQNKIDIDYAKNYKKDVLWINFWTDVYYSGKTILTGHLILRDYLHTLRLEKVHAVYDRNDKLPFIMMTIMLPYIIMKRT